MALISPVLDNSKTPRPPASRMILALAVEGSPVNRVRSLAPLDALICSTSSVDPASGTLTSNTNTKHASHGDLAVRTSLVAIKYECNANDILSEEFGWRVLRIEVSLAAASDLPPNEWDQASHQQQTEHQVECQRRPAQKGNQKQDTH